MRDWRRTDVVTCCCGAHSVSSAAFKAMTPPERGEVKLAIGGCETCWTIARERNEAERAARDEAKLVKGFGE